jgi:hypothetical protein
MIRSILKCFGVLLLIELILFICLAFTSMGDDKPAAIGRYFYWTLKYIFGFPLVLINDDYPYFLDHSSPTGAVICLGLLNDLILAAVLVGLVALGKRLFQTQK